MTAAQQGKRLPTHAEEVRSHGDVTGAVDHLLVAYSYGYAQGRADGEAAATELLPPCGPSVSHAELAERRKMVDTDPCRRRCRRCSQCLFSLAFWGRGGRDFLGVAAELEHLGHDDVAHPGHDARHLDLGQAAS